MKNDDKVKKETEEVEEKKEEPEKVKEEFVKKEEFDALTELVSQLDSNHKRALADYQNLQKRVSDDRINWIKSANQDLLLRILPVLDTLVLASQHSKDASLQVSLSQFLDVLKSEGLVRIETVGKKFDPMLMEAIDTIEGEEGKVIEEVRAGFLLHDKLLRAAQVKVGKK